MNPSSHMTRAGLSPEQRSTRLDLADVAEDWFAKRYHGRRATADEDQNDKWDVLIGDQRYDVKSVEAHHTWVDGGERKPRYPAPVVEVMDVGLVQVCRLRGVVSTSKWTKGVPREGFAPRWFIQVASIDPATILSLPVGTPLSEPRPCPSCLGDHPVGTTCAGGFAPWERPSYPWEDD